MVHQQALEYMDNQDFITMYRSGEITLETLLELLGGYV
jgi:hypothetical protein